MRKSRVLRQMRNGNVASCMKLNLSDIRNVEIAALCNFDSLWVDMEHIPNDFSFIENSVRAAKAYDVDIVCRVSKGCYSDIIRPFEADATGIMVPHLMSFEEAKQLVYYTKFHPIGRRPLDGGNADGKYCLVNENDYIKETNDERFVIIQIEDPEVLSELEDICALPGIDMIFFGPGDFSQGVGHPNESDYYEISEARKRIAECARKHGKWVGTTGCVENYDILIDMGYTFISAGADVLGLSEYYSGITTKISNRKIK